MEYNIRISGFEYKKIKSHLFPGDNKEAVAIAFCGRNLSKNIHVFTVHKVVLIPYSDCSIREIDYVQWSTSLIAENIEWAATNDLAILKIHSHPNGYPDFSETDNQSDKQLFSSVYGWYDSDLPHGSAIMLPDGKIVARIIDHTINFKPVQLVSIVGDDVLFFHKNELSLSIADSNIRTLQTFGKGTVSQLSQMKIGVVGCSGTGSPVIEQLVRLGVKSLVLVDPDEVKEKNLNRILNSTKWDAENTIPKVEMFKTTINKIGLGTKVKTYQENLYDNVETLKELATCDFLFGCMDSVDGRHLLNHLSTFYLVPYIDLGVKIIADGEGGVSHICGSIHYLQPGGSSLFTRNVYNSEDLRAAGLYRSNPIEYYELKKEGYIANVNEDRPAVISVNMMVSSMAVNEFLARIHGFRYDDNNQYAITRISLNDFYIQHEKEGKPDDYLKKFVGRGDSKPFLNMVELC